MLEIVHLTYKIFQICTIPTIQGWVMSSG